MALGEIISTASLSYDEIRRDLVEYVQSKPDNQKWVDYLESGAGITVTDLIAGLGSFNAFKQLMRRQESYLDIAQLESSIIELAFNRGFMLSPTDTLILDCTFNSETQTQISMEQEVALGPDFLVYATESKVIPPNMDTVVRCACGNLKTFSQVLSGLEEFQTFNFTFNDRYGSNTFESLVFNETLSVPLLSDLNYLQSFGNDFVLRRMLVNEARIYIGNGVLGWYDNVITSIKYKILTYSDGMFPSTLDIQTLIAAELKGFTKHQEPVYGMDKEEVRRTSIFYPIDGRIVTDSDYETIILKYFGGVLKGVYSYNEDHTQIVYLLTDTNYHAATHLPQIQQLVDQKRGSGILVSYIETPIEGGLDFILNLTIAPEYFYDGLINEVQAFLDLKLFKFWKETETLTTQKFAIELSAEFEIEFHPVDEISLDMVYSSFLKVISLTVN